MKTYTHILFAGLVLTAGTATTPVAAQVSPEIQLATRGVMSFNMDNAADRTTSAVNDFSDTALLLGFRQKMYNSYRAQMVIGLQFPDADSDLGQVFYHQIFLRLENKTNMIKMGRSRVRSALIEFPTLRDDDAIFFTDVLNPFSSGENTEDNQYGNVMEIARVFVQRFWVRLHGEHFNRTPLLPGMPETEFDLNAAGFSLQYRVPESQLWNRPFVQQIGVGVNTFLSADNSNSSTLNETLRNITVSAIFNLRPDPVHFIDLRHQTIINTGLDGVTTFVNFAGMARARSIASFSSLRYLYRKLERPTLQLAISFGYKTFPDLTIETNQRQLVLNGFYRIGENFDIGVQYQNIQFTGEMARLAGRSENRLQFSMIFAIDQLWNNQFDTRDSLLNLEHGYIQ